MSLTNPYDSLRPMNMGRGHKRKLEHLKIVLENDVEPVQSPFEKYQLPYSCLPNLDGNKVDTHCQFLGKKLSFPFLISSMTGGPLKSSVINKHLARAAETEKVALALGSMRVCLRNPDAIPSFQVRDLCPSIPLLANIGLVQLNYGVGADEINYLVDLIEADAIFLHINPLQEIVQPEGDRNFTGLVAKLAKILPKVRVPVLVKEVGNGIDLTSARRLLDAGVQWIDVSGLGGTSWSWVEGYRREDRLGFLLRKVGIPTDVCLKNLRQYSEIRLIAGGGIRNGLDMVKALILAARLCTAAKPLLAPALDSEDGVSAVLRQYKEEFSAGMFAVGAGCIEQLSRIVLSE